MPEQQKPRPKFLFFKAAGYTLCLCFLAIICFFLYVLTRMESDRMVKMQEIEEVLGSVIESMDATP